MSWNISLGNFQVSLTGWLILGFFAQAVFASRFIVQWIVSERKKRSTVPKVFWYLSLIGSSLLFVYALHLKDPVFMLGQSLNCVIYIRNLMLFKGETS
ncbi:hypothetical protein BLFGPEAP_00334 [Candidatus Methanoperedenaceae archaeon GB50]|uniref:Lipid A biosynthesis N-terminal domain-containing protein n=1 Tax=Desulfofervidus auxilii TaxID=1621989 RepID=A0A7V1N367_DESA2|nr:hypothetical protein BLFGPEAP_00334 [Candidatus Methanoperedenaceae archaeon GB50]CAD7771328.1 hypothetical protein DMNBHIDG_00363 [Candidatus Methanoperedenaceae archaeon GB37]CAD7780134.1 MAG: hypothetical protein KCCBMMGE_00929 [Candidatus Methanoperedenaceae archaeon GB37]HEB74223.1 hypothetical protein [Candidatus Desulfofervidus auxilii]